MRLASLLTLLLAAPTLAQDTVLTRDASGQVVRLDATADTDGDGIDNALELGGFEFDIVSGGLVPWDGDPEARYFITDPLRVSTDGDPYSDYQEATGANMPGSVQVPYNHPLVAARPIIAVHLESVEVLPNGTLTDQSGRSQSDAFTNETSNAKTATLEVSSSVEFSPTSFGGSVSLTGSESRTSSSTLSSTATAGFDWSTARTVSESEAAFLRLNVYYTNLGSAPASDVKPTLTVRLGDKTIATFQASANSTALSLAPGGRYPEGGTIAIDRYVAGEVEVQIALTLDELKAIQLGAPIELDVPQVEATIQRWNPATQSFSNEVTWSAFEDDIDPVSLAVQAVVDGEPTLYQVFATVPGVTPRRRTVREALDLILDVEDTAGGVTIEGRSYPIDWNAVTDSPGLVSAWEDAGRPQNVLGIDAVPGAELVLLSSTDGGARLDYATFSDDLRQVYVSATPSDGYPVTEAVATLFATNRTLEVRLDEGSLSAFLTNTDPVDTPYYGGFVRVTNARGASRVRDLTLPGPPTRFRACADLATAADGEYALYMTGRADRPVRVACDFSDDGTGLPIEDPWFLSPDAGGLVDANVTSIVYAVDETTALVTVSANGRTEEFLRSTDGGQTWAQVDAPSPAVDISGVDFVDGQTGFATATSPVTGSNLSSIILRTTDAGATWTRLTTPYDNVPSGGLERRLSDISVLDADRAIAVGGGAIYGGTTAGTATVLRTTDGGASWRPLDVAGYPNGRFRLVDYRQDAGGRSITVTRFDAILSSFDDGATWQAFTPSGIPGVEPGNIVSLSFPTADVGYAATESAGLPRVTRVLKTTDGGRTWEALFTDPGDTVTDLHFLTADEGFAVGGTDTILHTVDGGDTWYRQDVRASGRTFRDVHVRDGLALLSASSGDSNDPNGRVWVTTPSANFAVGPRGEPYTIRPRGLLVYAGDPRAVDGATTLDQAAAFFGRHGVVVFEGLDYDVHNGSDVDYFLRDLYAHPAMAETRVYGAVDLGVTTANQDFAGWALDVLFWRESLGKADGVVLANLGSAFGVDRSRRCEAIGFARGYGDVVAAGLTLEDLTAQDDQPCDTDRTDYTAAQARLGAGDAVLVEGYQVRDGAFVDGPTWRAEADALRAYTEPLGVGVMALATGETYTQAAFDYAWLSAVVDEISALGWTDADRGADARPIVFTAPQADPGRTYFTDLSVDLPTVRRTTEGGPIVIDTQTHTATFGETGGGGPVDAEGDDAVPALELAQSFPNPTSARATILYRLAEAGPVRLAVYDLLGREVVVLADGPRTAGEHEVRLDASRLASGVYLYRLSAGDQAETRRFTVVR